MTGNASSLRVVSRLAIVAFLGLLAAGLQVPVRATDDGCPVSFPNCTGACPTEGGCQNVSCQQIPGGPKQCLYTECVESCTNNRKDCLGDGCTAP